MSQRLYQAGAEGDKREENRQLGHCQNSLWGGREKTRGHQGEEVGPQQKRNWGLPCV
jgi:hypothetical protein